MKTLTFALALGCGPALATEITPQMLDSLPPAQVYVLGEVHDNPLHHRHQARAVQALQPKAIVFEMFNADTAARITAQNRTDAAALEQALEWADLGWPPFSQYYPIFAAAPEAAIYGGGVPREQLRASVMQGAASVLGDGAADFALDQPLPDTQQTARETLQMEAHCNALPEEMLGGMVEAQRLRDAMLAQQARLALQEVGTPVVVITGNGHARTDWGLPAALEAAQPGVELLSIAQFETTPPWDEPFDMWLVTPPVDREDPCAAFHSKG